MTKRIFIPTDGPEDWKRFLADPDRHWKHGYSAFARLFGLEAEAGKLLSAPGDGPVALYLGWAVGT